MLRLVELCLQVGEGHFQHLLWQKYSHKFIGWFPNFKNETNFMWEGPKVLHHIVSNSYLHYILNLQSNLQRYHSFVIHKNFYDSALHKVWYWRNKYYWKRCLYHSHGKFNICIPVFNMLIQGISNFQENDF